MTPPPSIFEKAVICARDNNVNFDTHTLIYRGFGWHSGKPSTYIAVSTSKGSAGLSIGQYSAGVEGLPYFEIIKISDLTKEDKIILAETALHNTNLFIRWGFVTPEESHILIAYNGERNAECIKRQIKKDGYCVGFHMRGFEREVDALRINPPEKQLIITNDDYEITASKSGINIDGNLISMTDIQKIVEFYANNKF